jgi:uncharacterized protein (DUF488 family)
MELYTIGFTEKSAETFFNLLIDHSISLVADVRLNNTSQLAGFSKKDDLAYFLSLTGIGYVHLKQLAPDKTIRQELLETGDWNSYSKQYIKLIRRRKAVDEELLNLLTAGRTALLCAEADAGYCHRRLAAEEIKRICGSVQIIHL